MVSKRKSNWDAVLKSCGDKDRKKNIESEFAKKSVEFKKEIQGRPYV